MNLSLAEASRRIHAGELTPLDLTKACIKQIEAHNETLNAFLHVMRRHALQEAEYATYALERGENWGPLHGIPIGVKDLIDVDGTITTAASDFLREAPPAQSDAEVITSLKAAGAIIIGKTHLHEYAIGATTVNPHYGPAHNPWDVELSPGGSSGGSAAAVAVGMCPAALGTDTGGSVRVPSAYCGLTGLRPGVHQVSTEGVIPMSWTLDTVGPMTHSVHDVALMMDALTNRTDTLVHSMQQSADGLRIGLPEGIWLETTTDVVRFVREAVDQMTDIGMERIEIDLPSLKAANRAAGIISLCEAAAYHKERMSEQPERFDPDVRTRLEIGQSFSGVDYALARHQGRAWREELQTLFRGPIDVIALPVSPILPPPIATSSVDLTKQILQFTYPFSLSGLPSLSLPCGFTDDGLPVGLQLVAPTVDMLLRVGYAYQQATDWHTRQPDRFT